MLGSADELALLPPTDVSLTPPPHFACWHHSGTASCAGLCIADQVPPIWPAGPSARQEFPTSTAGAAFLLRFISPRETAFRLAQSGLRCATQKAQLAPRRRKLAPTPICGTGIGHFRGFVLHGECGVTECIAKRHEACNTRQPSPRHELDGRCIAVLRKPPSLDLQLRDRKTS